MYKVYPFSFLRTSWEGEGVPDTLEGNGEEALWTGETRPCDEMPPLLPLVPWPSSLSLGVKVVFSFLSSGTVVQNKRGSLTFPPIRLYDHERNLGVDGESQDWCDQSFLQSVRLVYRGEGQSLGSSSSLIHFQGRKGGPFSLNFSSGGIIYEKFFQTQEEASVVQHIEALEKGEWVSTPPGRKNTRALYPYGGIYKPGMSLEEIEQLYFYITDNQDHTQIFSRPFSYWKNSGFKGLSGGWKDGTSFLFMDSWIEEKEKCSLGQCLRKGEALLWLEVSSGSQGQVQRQMYASKGYEREAAEDEFLLLFQRQD